MKISTYLHLHLSEFKYNLFIFFFCFSYLFFILYIYSNQIIFIFTKILINKIILKYFIFTNVTEIFITNFFLAVIISSIIIIPFLYLQIWNFLYKGLYIYENIKLLKAFFFFFFFNFLIIYIICLNIIPNIWFFFINININSNFLFNIYFEPKLNTYIFFLLDFFIYIYLLFFYFILLFFYFIKKIFRIKTILILRKFCYLKFFLISLLITPPDILSQLLCLFILIFFFELLLFIYIYLNKYFKNDF